MPENLQLATKHNKTIPKKQCKKKNKKKNGEKN